MLGIAPATLRRWADHGDVATFVTPGGHRRFPRIAIEALIPKSSGRRPGGSFGASASRVARAYSRTRGRPAASPVVANLTDAARMELRDRGQRLLALLLGYLDGGRLPSTLAEAEREAADYGRRAFNLGVSPSDTVEAFVRFRRAFVSELAVIARRRGLNTRDATALLVEAEGAVDRLLVALMDGHAGVWG
jgi:hypothetical protein